MKYHSGQSFISPVIALTLSAVLSCQLPTLSAFNLSSIDKQCDFRFDLFFSLSFSFSFASYQNIKHADEDVLMICLNTVHR